MKKAVILAGPLLAAFFAALPSAPATAQRVDNVLTIYGNDPCPTSNGEEIVVCKRLDERERYRIPEELRGSLPSPGNERWADRAKSLEYVGASGTGSCTANGNGGWTGCWSRLMKQARDERKQAAASEREAP
ncbi:hypothetical protein CLG96_01060 [Sphingomonas oleivorans]|uniref:Uncharacterized protein n=1 Tax=Sphingomonas oleivorans TaxID=1735121 RepID=A0A2T5G0V9_9SPHN|nr:hypothetical protein [Sphingomonas oleivorans]PTQ12772.1 hypothetical protein CLG96_01060 [Sphingomonas oleivorans]